MIDIFVFGSNLAGIHGKGAALDALRHHGAIRGKGIGLQGRAYAIPTKNKDLQRLSLRIIEQYITIFLNFARANPDHKFLLTAIGTGLAGYEIGQIRALFKGKNIPENVVYHGEPKKNILK